MADHSRLDGPLVSIIITCYNYGRYLSQAIDSVLAQSYGPIELIVVDDGSTDNTAQVAKSYGDKLHYIHQTNQGVVAARNRGAKEAKGIYMSFLDADDWYDPGYIHSLVATLSRAPKEVAYTYGDLCLTNGRYQTLVPSEEFSLVRLMYRNLVSGCALVRASAFQQVGGYGADDAKGYSFEDWDLWLSLAEAGYIGRHAAGANASPYFYRLHGSGRNLTGEQYRSELIAQLQQDHPGLYQNRHLIRKFRLARRWWKFKDMLDWHIRKLTGRVDWYER